VYYVILALAVAGWLRLRISRPEVAYALLFYAVVVTALHLPLTMNTRLRSPLFDPLLASLAGCGAQPLHFVLPRKVTLASSSRDFLPHCYCLRAADRPWFTSGDLSPGGSAGGGSNPNASAFSRSRTAPHDLHTATVGFTRSPQPGHSAVSRTW